MSDTEYLDLADKFNEARWGRGPGIGKDQLATIGLKFPKTFTSKTTGRRHTVHGDWENLCCYVWEQLCTEAWPGSNARGRGFHSQQCGERIVKLLTNLSNKGDE